MKYEITMNDSSVRVMTIIDPATTIEAEISKWIDSADVQSWQLIEGE